MDVLTISLGRNILKGGSRERERMHSYAKHLDALHIVVLTRREHGFKGEIHEGSLHIYPTNSSSRILMLWDSFCIARKIIQESRTSPLRISAQDPLEIGWLCFLLSRMQNTKLHVQVHGDYFSSEDWVGHSLVRRLRRCIALFLLKHTPRIRVVSERIKKSLIERGIDASRISVLPIRPEIESFLKAAHKFREKPPYTFLFIGRLAAEKNIPRIVRAFSVIHEKFPESSLRIVGEGEMQKTIEELVESLNLKNAAAIVPWTEDVPGEMEKADIFLLASLHEAYALTLVEAMAVGLPIVTTDVGCVDEVVKDSVHGVVVYEKDVSSYVSAMERMVNNQEFRKLCGENGRKTAQALAGVSVDEYAEAWVTALKE